MLAELLILTDFGVCPLVELACCALELGDQDHAREVCKELQRHDVEMTLVGEAYGREG